ncbi:MAG: DNA topoisomerase I [Thermoplasmatota archaeon]
MNTLVICEKNMAASRIAYILSDGSSKRSRINGVPCYTFNDGAWNVIGLRGHIVDLDYPKKYNQWNQVSPLELVDVEPVRKTSNQRIASALKKLAGEADRLIVATDYDREGELIGVEGVDLLNGSHQVERAKFSSLMPYEIRQAFDSTGNVDRNLSASAEARRIIDLAWGATLTRFISLASNQLGKDFLSVGRVQSPTLALIVNREKEREAFEPTPYWRLTATCTNETSFEAEHRQGKFWDGDEASQIYEKIQGTETGTVQQYEREEKSEYPPSPFNTTSFLRQASSLGFSAGAAMKIAESLYMRGLISYPRTDNTVYPPGLPITGILEKLSEVFPKEVGLVQEKRREKPTRGKKFSKDHPPIHPVGATSKDKLNQQEWRIYELIVRRFLASLTLDARAAVSAADIDIAGEPFEAEGYELLEANWRAIYPHYNRTEKPLHLTEGETLTIEDIEKTRHMTKPPRRYQQGSLLAMMEQNNLGTKSTRHDIIGKLYARNYISGKWLKPTPTGRAVIEALERSAERITKPDMTAELEHEMNEIAEGEKTLEEVVDDSRRLLKEALLQLEQRKDVIGDVIQEAMFKQRYMGKCTKCGGNLMLIRSRRGKRFIGCENYPDCTNSYPLPQKGRVLFDDEYCQECGAPLVTTIYKGKWKKCVNMDCPSNQKD